MLSLDDRCPSNSPFNFSSWKPGNSRNLSGPCRKTIFFQSSYFLTTCNGNFAITLSNLWCSRICHIININNLLKLISQDIFKSITIKITCAAFRAQRVSEGSIIVAWWNRLNAVSKSPLLKYTHPFSTASFANGLIFFSSALLDIATENDIKITEIKTC